MDRGSSPRVPQIALLALERGPLQPSLCDERNLIQLSSQHFPGERLVVCRYPLLAEGHLDEVSASRASPVLKVIRSEHAKAKDASKLADDGVPLCSFRTSLKDLGTLTHNMTCTGANPSATIAITSRPKPMQDKAFKLLAISPNCSR